MKIAKFLTTEFSTLFFFPLKSKYLPKKSNYVLRFGRGTDFHIRLILNIKIKNEKKTNAKIKPVCGAATERNRSSGLNLNNPHITDTIMFYVFRFCVLSRFARIV
jgi:hypothetical protein